MRCATNFMRNQKKSNNKRCNNYGGRFLWAKDVEKINYKIRPPICGCDNPKRLGSRKPDTLKEVQHLRNKCLNKINDENAWHESNRPVLKKEWKVTSNEALNSTCFEDERRILAKKEE